MSLASPYSPLQQAGVRALAPGNVFIYTRAPTTSDYSFNVGDAWVWLNNAVWTLVGKPLNVANWVTSSTAGALDTLSADDGNTAVPIAGDILIHGGVAISTTAAGKTVTIDLDIPVTVPQGGTGDTTITGVLTGNGVAAITGSLVTEHSVLVGGSSNAVDSLVLGAEGRLLVGHGIAADPEFETSANGDFTFTTATAAATRTLAVANTDNTALSYSGAALNLSVGGTTTTGDPFVHWAVTGGREYALGIDNTDDDAFKLTIGANPSSGAATEFITIDAAGPSMFIYGDIQQQYDGPGIAVDYRLWNTSLLAGSESNFSIGVQGAASADPFTSWNVGVVGAAPITSWVAGISNANSDVWRLVTNMGASAKPGTGSIAMQATTAGEITLPLQPAFSAYNSIGRANATGDGTVFTLIFNQESYDQNADFDGTSTFTAPVDGIYHFDVMARLTGVGVAHTEGYIALNHVAINVYYGPTLNCGAMRSATNLLSMGMSAEIKMTAGETVVAVVAVSNSTKTITVDGTSIDTYFNGRLVC